MGRVQDKNLCLVRACFPQLVDVELPVRRRYVRVASCRRWAEGHVDGLAALKSDARDVLVAAFRRSLGAQQQYLEHSLSEGYAQVWRGHDDLVSFVEESREEGVHADICAGGDENLRVRIKISAVARREALSQGIAQSKLSSRDGVVAVGQVTESHVNIMVG